MKIIKKLNSPTKVYFGINTLPKIKSLIGSKKKILVITSKRGHKIFKEEIKKNINSSNKVEYISRINGYPSTLTVDSLFKKAGIIRCYGRNELITVASIFMHPELTGKNIAIITHAGGPAVMLTDSLSSNGLNVPEINGEASKE